MRMKRSFLLLTLLWGALSAWAHDAEVNGIFYNLNKANKTATITYKGDSFDAYDDEYAGDVVIPKAVTFGGISYSVTSLGVECFMDCRSLTSITIPNSVTSLGDDCFSECSSLTSITIGNSVTSLGDWCFSGCSSLTFITIPNSVTSLGDECFSDCSSLTSIYMLPTTPPSTGSEVFYGTSLGTVYVVSENTKTAYQAQEPWNNYAIVVMPTGIEELETDKTTPTIVGYYDLNGKPINGKQRGAAILRYSDGTTRKVLVK